MEGYALDWRVMTVYCALIFAVVANVASFLVGITLAIGGAPVPEKTSDQAATFLFAPGFLNVWILMYVSYRLGGWVGARVNRHPKTALALGIITGRAIMLGFDFLMDATIASLVVQQWRSIEGFAGVAILMAMLIGLAIFASRRGRRRRAAAYMAYLLRSIPADTRDVLIHLTYEEAKRLKDTSMASIAASA
jgi:hypothetical protein